MEVPEKKSNTLLSKDDCFAHQLDSQKNKLEKKIKKIKLNQTLSGQKWRNFKKYLKRKWKKFSNEMLQGENQKDQIVIEINEEPQPQKQQQQRQKELINNRFKCEICDKIYASKYNLKRHFAQIHQGLKEFGKQKKK